MIEKKGNGNNFIESKYLMIENLNILYDEGILMERPRDRDKKYELVKGDIYVIDPKLVHVTVGLGWDASQGMFVSSIVTKIFEIIVNLTRFQVARISM